MNKTKEDKIVNWLKNKQDEIRKQYKSLLKEGKGYDHRGIWISVRCGCGWDYRTSYYIKPNGRCSRCNKKIWTFQKIKEI